MPNSERSLTRNARRRKKGIENGNINTGAAEIVVTQGVQMTTRIGTEDTEGTGRGQDPGIPTETARGDTDIAGVIDLGQKILLRRGIDNIDAGTDTARALHVGVNVTIVRIVIATDDAPDHPRITSGTTRTNIRDGHHAHLGETTTVKRGMAAVVRRPLTRGVTTRTRGIIANDLVLPSLSDGITVTDSRIHALLHPTKSRRSPNLLRVLPRSSPKCRQTQAPWRNSVMNGSNYVK